PTPPPFPYTTLFRSLRRRGTLDDAQRACERPGRIADRDPRACTAEVESDDPQRSASTIACLPATSASRSPAGFLPPASASVGRPDRKSTRLNSSHRT